MIFGLVASLLPSALLLTADPALTFERFVRNRALEIHGRLVGYHGDSPRHLLRLLPVGDPAWLEQSLRLADIFDDKAWYHDAMARQLDASLVRASLHDRPLLEKARADNLAEREHWRQEAEKTFLTTSGYPGYERAPEVLLHFGCLVAWSGDHQHARELFDRLLREYPLAPAASDAAVWLGELAFQEGDIPAALALYQKIAQWQREHWRSFAVYRIGWCQLKLGRPEAALETFVAVVRLAEQDPALKTSERATLAREAKKDVVKAFAQAGQSGDAPDLFRQIGGDYAPQMLSALAESYRRQGRLDVAAAVSPPEPERSGKK